MYIYREQRQDSGELWILDKEGKRLAAIERSDDSDYDHDCAEELARCLNDPASPLMDGPAYCISQNGMFSTMEDDEHFDQTSTVYIDDETGTPVAELTSYQDARVVLGILNRSGD